MTPIEIIALIVIIASAIKMFVLIVNPQSWMNFARGIYNKPNVAKFIGFILAIVVLYYLIGAGITIVQILAVTAFVALLFVIGLAGEIDDLLKKYQSLIKKGKLWKKHWFYALLWIALLIWGVKELFF